MEQFKLNITSEPNDFKLLEEGITSLCKEPSSFKIQLMRMDNPTPKNTMIEIDVEYPLIGHNLIKLTKEYSNLTFDVIDWESSHIMNKVVIVKE